MLHLLLAAVPLMLVGVVLSMRAAEPAHGATSAPSQYVPLTPFRRVDTRTGHGATWVNATTLDVPIAGRDGVPAGATAVVVTVVVTGGTGAGFLTAYPSGIERPNTSIINYERGHTYNTEAIVPLGADGAMRIHTLTPAQVVVDVTGAFVPADSARAGRFTSVEPDRIVDTRTTSVMTAGETRRIDLPGYVPTDATAVAVTLTTTAPNRPGFFTAWPRGTRPDTSTLNVPFRDATRATTAIVPVDEGEFKVHSSAGGHLIVDVVGYFTGASAPSSSQGLFVPIDPVRTLDTRRSQRLAAGETRGFATKGQGSAVGSLAMIQPWSPGYASIYANGTKAPETSSINHAGVPAIAAMALSRTTTAGVSIFSSTSSDYLFDQYGYFTSPHSEVTEDIAPTTPNPPAGRAPGVPDASGCTISEILVPSCGIWFGATTNDRADTFDYATGLAEYEAVAQNVPDILHFYKNGSQRFPTRGEVAMSERPGKQRSLLFYNWKPSNSNWAAVARGSNDAEIDTIATSIKSYPHTIFLTIWHEGEDEVRPTPGSGRTPADYAAMWRHVVDELRARNVDNVVFVWTVMGYSGWRDYLDGMYPGHGYVDWIGYDPYAKDNIHTDVYEVINRSWAQIGWPGFYKWAVAKAPGKPLILTEWGVDVLSNSDPARVIRASDPAEIQRRFPMLKAMMYWNDANIWNPRIDQTSAKGRALGAAYRDFAAHPVFNAMTPDGAP